MNFIRKYHLYVVFFGIYPVLALYDFNIRETRLFAISQALVFSLLVTLLFTGLLFIFYRNWQKTAVAACVLLVLFFLYGHFFNLINGVVISGVSVGRHRYWLPLWILMLLISLIWIARTRRDLRNTINILSLSGLALMVMALTNIGWFGLTARENATPVKPGSAGPMPAAAGSNPDIYYILVDSYSRQDVLRDVFGLDSSDFLDELEALGFFIPNCTQSNYAYTTLSLTSSLNMNYVDQIGIPGIDTGSVDLQKFTSRLKNSLVRQKLESLGYSTITLKVVNPYLDIQDSTYYYDYYRDAGSLESVETLNFQYLFLNTTMLRPVIEYLEFDPRYLDAAPGWISYWLPIGATASSRNYRQYMQNRYLLDSLKTAIPDLPGPKFVFAHLFVTHQPFVFNPDGSFRVSPRQDNDAYRDQVAFADTQLIEIVKAILKKSAVPPVIIIQGDHAYPKDPGHRMRILNAYYLPGAGSDDISPTMSPVNTFRIIFDRYFGSHYDYLPDRSFFSKSEQMLKFQEIPSSCIKNQEPAQAKGDR